MLEDPDTPEALWQRGLSYLKQLLEDIHEMLSLQHGLANVWPRLYWPVVSYFTDAQTVYMLTSGSGKDSVHQPAMDCVLGSWDLVIQGLVSWDLIMYCAASMDARLRESYGECLTCFVSNYRQNWRINEKSHLFTATRGQLPVDLRHIL